MLPDNIVLGPFEKGTSKLWMACEGYFFPQFYSNFYDAPKHFTEIVRSDSHAHAAAELYNYMLTGARAYVNGQTTPKPLVPMCEPLQARVTEKFEHISSSLHEHNQWCKDNKQPRQMVSSMSNTARSCGTKLVDQGCRKLCSGTIEQKTSTRGCTNDVPALVHGLHTPRERYPGVVRRPSSAAARPPLCDCRAMTRPPPEPPPTTVHTNQVGTRRRRYPAPVRQCHLVSMHDGPLQLVCAYLGAVDSVPLLPLENICFSVHCTLCASLMYVGHGCRGCFSGRSGHQSSSRA